MKWKLTADCNYFVVILCLLIYGFTLTPIGVKMGVKALLLDSSGSTLGEKLLYATDT